MATVALIIPVAGHVGGGPLPGGPSIGGGPIYPSPSPPGIWGGAPPQIGYPLPPSGPVDPGYGRPVLPPYASGQPIYPGGYPTPGPLPPGWAGGPPSWAGGVPMPPYVPGNLPPYASGQPIYPGGHPGGGPIYGLPPYASGQPIYPGGYPTPGPIPLPPVVPPPDKPNQGVDPIPIGDSGWTLQWWKGMGWVLVPPEPEPPTAGPK